MNLFQETTPAESRIIKKKYSSCSDHLAVAKIFSEWSNTQDRYIIESNGHTSNTSLSKTSLVLIYSEYLLNLFIYF